MVDVGTFQPTDTNAYSHSRSLNITANDFDRFTKMKINELENEKW